MKRFDARALLFGPIDRLRNVIRFGTCRRHVPENVAEHSYYVVLYSLILALEATERGWGPVKLRTVLARATVHDIEECVTGDFPRPFKYSDATLKMQLDLASATAVDQLAGTLWVDEGDHPRQQFMAFWESAKGDDHEGEIVRLADFLSALGYVYREWSSGNVSIEEHLTSLPDYRRTFKGTDLESAFADLFEVVDEVLGTVKPKGKTNGS